MNRYQWKLHVHTYVINTHSSVVFLEHGSSTSSWVNTFGKTLLYFYYNWGVTSWTQRLPLHYNLKIQTSDTKSIANFSSQLQYTNIWMKEYVPNVYSRHTKKILYTEWRHYPNTCNTSCPRYSQTIYYIRMYILL